MKSRAPKLLSLAALLVWTNANYAESPFEAAAEHLDLDGSVVAFVDFDGDGQEIGEKLNVIYQRFTEANPQMPPIPVDFPTLFNNLGFGSIKSMGVSSKELDNGLVRNVSVLMLDGEPAGLVSVYGMEPIRFRAAEIAPLGATTAFSGQINLAALRDVITTLLAQVMGPMGQGMAEQSLTQMVPGTDIQISELINALSGRMDFVMYQDFSNPMMPDLKIYLSIEGAGGILPRLEAYGTAMGAVFGDEGDGMTADFSSLAQESPMGLHLKAPVGSDQLLFFTDPTWAESLGGGENLTSDPKFQAVAGALPEEAAFYSYSAGFDPEPFYGFLQMNPDLAPYIPVIQQAVDLFIADFFAPNAGATFRDGDAIVTDQYASYSLKQAIALIPTIAGVGAGLATAIEQRPEPAVWQDPMEENYPAEAEESLEEEGQTE